MGPFHWTQNYTCKFPKSFYETTKPEPEELSLTFPTWLVSENSNSPRLLSYTRDIQSAGDFECPLWTRWIVYKDPFVVYAYEGSLVSHACEGAGVVFSRHTDRLLRIFWVVVTSNDPCCRLLRKSATSHSSSSSRGPLHKRRRLRLGV